MEALRQLLWRRRFTVLFLSILATVLVPLLIGEKADPSGLVEPDDRLIGLLLGGVLIAAVHAIANKPRKAVVFSIAALIVFGGRIASVFGEPFRYQYQLDAGSYATLALFLFTTIGVVYLAIIRAPRITGDVVMGAISVYLLIGFAWSNLYSLIWHLDEHSFRFPDYLGMADGANIPEYTFGYYSFVTLTTLGYGDITPVTYPARTLSWLEAVIGVAYMATVIAFLVSQVVIDREAGHEL